MNIEQTNFIKKLMINSNEQIKKEYIHTIELYYKIAKEMKENIEKKLNEF